MQHENLKKVVELCERIDKHLNDLNYLRRRPDVIVGTPNERIFTIGTGGNSEHPYADHAKQFIKQIEDDLIGQINKLKIELAEL